MDYTKLCMADAALLHTAQDQEFWRRMKATQPRSTCERNRTKALRLLKKQSFTDEYDEQFALALMVASGG
ncbi:hypothetical protein [Hymenobacter jejuensis]|uniref:Uncharacterized protein n=1 Tax=Hymenobacter jejuensis TaxID=2502781 RepID=A0A5B8A244_9BACT|nr:hypothetical protein [Hymenobacter jejuensis]QDA60262.1 hypothetical protein FHG12_09115 [Hymenobacter jejuensis]